MDKDKVHGYLVAVARRIQARNPKWGYLVDLSLDEIEQVRSGKLSTEAHSAVSKEFWKAEQVALIVGDIDEYRRFSDDLSELYEECADRILKDCADRLS